MATSGFAVVGGHGSNAAASINWRSSGSLDVVIDAEAAISALVASGVVSTAEVAEHALSAATATSTPSTSLMSAPQCARAPGLAPDRSVPRRSSDIVKQQGKPRTQAFGHDTPVDHAR